MLSGDVAPDQPRRLQVTYTYRESDNKITLHIRWEVSIQELRATDYIGCISLKLCTTQ